MSKFNENVIKIKNCLEKIANDAPYHKDRYGDETRRKLIPLGTIFSKVRELGFTWGNIYHAHGIGNNNEITVYESGVDVDGYPTKRAVGTLHYTESIYGKTCYIAFNDAFDNQHFYLEACSENG